jgi:hypothetical protein
MEPKIFTYDEMRAMAGDGDVMFLTVNKRDFLSRLTSWFTKSPFTHAAFLFWYHGRLMVVESTTHGGIRIVQASTYKDRMFGLIEAPRPWEFVIDDALVRSGTAEYGWFSAMYIGMREFFWKQFHIKLPMNKNNRNKACSEFVAEVLRLKDVDISPKILYDILSAR